MSAEVIEIYIENSYYSRVCLSLCMWMCVCVWDILRKGEVSMFKTEHNQILGAVQIHYFTSRGGGSWLGVRQV